MPVRISGLPFPDQVEAMRLDLERAPWSDRRATAGRQSGSVKHNLQFGAKTPLACELKHNLLRERAEL